MPSSASPRWATSPSHPLSRVSWLVTVTTSAGGISSGPSTSGVATTLLVSAAPCECGQGSAFSARRLPGEVHGGLQQHPARVGLREDRGLVDEVTQRQPE